MTEIEHEAAQRFVRFVEKNDPSIDFLVKIFQLSGWFLNVQSVKDYADERGLTPQAIYKSGKAVKNFGLTMVIDPE